MALASYLTRGLSGVLCVAVLPSFSHLNPDQAVFLLGNLSPSVLSDQSPF